MKHVILIVIFSLFSFNILSAQNLITTQCADTLTYPLANTSTFRGINVFDSSASALAQWYSAPNQITLHGFEFFGYENDPNVTNPVQVIGKVYTANGKLPDQMLASDTIMVSSNAGPGAYPYNRRQFITFTNPITVTGPFILSVEAPGSTMLVVLTNNWDTQDGKSLFYNSAKIGGIWYNGNNVNVGGIPFNSDILLHPIVSYNLSSSFTMDKNCIEDGEIVGFTHSASNFFSHEFFNQYAYNDTTDQAYHWDYGDGNISKGMHPGAHTYTTKGKYVITVTDSIKGWRNNCIITHKDSVDQQPIADFNYGVESNRLNLTNTSVGADELLWVFGDGTLSKLENPSYGYVDGGVYDVSLIITNACGSDTITKNIQVFDIGVDDAKKEPNISVYPNPARNFITISFSDMANKEFSAELYNILGERVAEKELEEVINEINIQALPSGTYFLKISGEDGQYIRKIIKE